MTYTLTDFDYALPAELIAQAPLQERSASRLMVLDRVTETIAHRQFQDIIDALNPNDLLVLNNTKVIPARLFGQKSTGGQVECMIERILDQATVLAQLRSSKSPKPGALLSFAEGKMQATMLRREGEFFVLQFDTTDIIADLETYGLLPLPPYIERAAEKTDYNRYQTVFAKHEGAVAAPTAGLHFTKDLLDALRAKGVSIAEITLHVGAGTFQPVREEDISAHQMHSEWIDVNASVVAAIEYCKASGGRVIAVGTTVLRALESAALTGELRPYQGETDIFITPGYTFHCIDGLVTNFHLPKSTLLMLISAFAGFEFTRTAYQSAIQEGYRFFSYGDAMCIL